MQSTGMWRRAIWKKKKRTVVSGEPAVSVFGVKASSLSLSFSNPLPPVPCTPYVICLLSFHSCCSRNVCWSSVTDGSNRTWHADVNMSIQLARPGDRAHLYRAQWCISYRSYLSSPESEYWSALWLVSSSHSTVVCSHDFFKEWVSCQSVL